MNIIIHTLFGVAELLPISFACGLASALIYTLLKQSFLILSAVRCDRFSAYRSFKQSLSCAKPSRFVELAADYVCCLTMAVLTLCSAFLLNSGDLRLLSVIAVIFGCIAGVPLWTVIVRSAAFVILFCIKRLIDIIMFPFVRLFGFAASIVTKACGGAYDYFRKLWLKKYTAYKFAIIEKEASRGLLDDHFGKKQ